MSEYRRAVQNGGLFFFTVVSHKRKAVFNNKHNIEVLRESFKREMKRRPFTLEAIVVLPDHLHCLWQLPKNDSDYSSRWREIKNIQQNSFQLSEIFETREIFGKGGIGNIKYGMKQIGAIIWTTFTIIQLNMAMFLRLDCGSILHLLNG